MRDRLGPVGSEAAGRPRSGLFWLPGLAILFGALLAAVGVFFLSLFLRGLFGVARSPRKPREKKSEPTPEQDAAVDARYEEIP